MLNSVVTVSQFQYSAVIKISQPPSSELPLKHMAATPVSLMLDQYWETEIFSEQVSIPLYKSNSN